MPITSITCRPTATMSRVPLLTPPPAALTPTHSDSSKQQRRSRERDEAIEEGGVTASESCGAPVRKRVRREDVSAEEKVSPSPPATATLSLDSPLSTQSPAATTAPEFDFRSVLKQAALERATRTRQASGSASASSSSGTLPLAATASPPPTTSSPPLPAATSSRVPPRLRLQISSPNGGGGGSCDLRDGRISTPVVYTGPGGSPNFSPRPSPSPSPADDLAGFELYNGLPTYSTPPSLAASVPSSGASREKSTSTAEVECPLCSHTFPPNIIERHAAACIGESAEDAVRISDIDEAALRESSAASRSIKTTSPAAAATTLPFTIHCSSPTRPLAYFPRHHDTLKLLTWNCWFDDLCMRQRMDAIGSVIEVEQPHFVALQEVTEASLGMIRRSNWIHAYHVTERSAAPYFTLLCSKFAPLGPGARRLPFQSEMARDLLCLNVEVPTSAGTRRITLATSHLESEYRRKDARRQQLEAALRQLRASKNQTPTALYCGDMNLVGSEAADLVQKYSWIDTWTTLRGAPARGTETAGATVDTRLNRMLATRPGRKAKSDYRARLDRIWMRLGSGEKRAATSAVATQGKGTANAAASSSPQSPIATPSSADTSSPPPEWRLDSIARVGMCAVDLRRADHYADDPLYKESVTPSSSPQSSPPAAAATATADADRKESGGSSPTDLIVFPSDHFGLVMTMTVIGAQE